MNKLYVTIGPNGYTIVSDRSEEEIRRIAQYISDEVERIEKRNKRLNQTMQATLAAFNIADELFNLQRAHRELEEKSKEPMERFGPLTEKYQDQSQKLNVFEAKINELEIALEKEKVENARYRDLVENALKTGKDLEALRKNLAGCEEKLATLSKEYQEYRRSHP